MDNIKYDNWKPLFIIIPTISFYSIKLSNERTYFIAFHWLFSSLRFKLVQEQKIMKKIKEAVRELKEA